MRLLVAGRLKACYPVPMSLLRALLEQRESVVLMGILNRTPDSFSDGGEFLDDAAAVERIDTMVRSGAAVVDIGAESTRPGAPAIPAKEQIRRLGNIIQVAARRGAIISVDTTSPIVAEHALRHGAAIVNSVSLEPAAHLGELCAAYGASLVLVHSRGSMSTMPGFSIYADDAYEDVVADVGREWTAAAQNALARGLPRNDLVLDPGLGFAKNARHSVELCARLDELVALGFPVLVGASRKSFLSSAAGPGRPLVPATERLGGSIAATLACAERGAAIVRTHDVAETLQALAVAAAIRQSSTTGLSNKGLHPSLAKVNHA